MDGDDPGTRRTVRHTDVPSALCLPFEEEADRNKETADLSARRLRILGLILGTVNPLTIGIDAENQWVYSFSCQS